MLPLTMEAMLVVNVTAESVFGLAAVNKSGSAKYASDSVRMIQKSSVGKNLLSLSRKNFRKFFGPPNLSPSFRYALNSFWPIKKPDRAKNISTAIKPPGKIPGKQWYITTIVIATNLSASRPTILFLVTPLVIVKLYYTLLITGMTIGVWPVASNKICVMSSLISSFKTFISGSVEIDLSVFCLK